MIERKNQRKKDVFNNNYIISEMVANKSSFGCWSTTETVNPFNLISIWFLKVINEKNIKI